VELTFSPHEAQASRNPSDGKPSPEKGPKQHRRSKKKRKKERKKERRDDGRIHVKVIIICKQHKGVSELAAAGI
jgi:hypothetical protein